ncbi:Hpt domain-containing protein [Maridesulfovibrio frigidus]|uniref:Hpt domain-containing protein n=1 Tax=Maridesulfovibrio frigidus TaxID=340956 RepID=UPI0004E1B2BA|nr:Hpt domain-containing protein [Maridesulfovibrio frigidus]
MDFSEKKINIVFIESALIDLVPILIETLSKELADMEILLRSGKLADLQDLNHSSRGAALTYGFDDYAEILIVVKKAVQCGDREGARSLLGQLRNMLGTVEFRSLE